MTSAGFLSPFASDPYRAGRWLAALTIASAAVSISLTQVGMALTVLFVLFRRAQQAHGSSVPSEIFGNGRARFGIPPVLLAGGALFVWLGVVTLVQRFISGPAPRSPGEFTDAGLFVFALFLFVLARTAPPEDRVLARGLEAFIWILLLSGLVACFSEFRLARLLTGHGFIASPANRPQHPFPFAGGLDLFRPVGFMNTRLTYAGLLVLVLPYILGNILAHFRGAAKNPESTPREILPMIAGATQALLALTLLFINGTRSAWIGAICGILFALPLLLEFWRPAWPRRIRGRSWLAGTVCLLLLGTGGWWMAGKPVARDALPDSLARHTDFQRKVIWTGSGAIVAERPLLGTGPGRFRSATLEWRQDFLRESPHTLYWIYLTPSGHAHNDLLHLAAVGGIPAGLLFLGLAFLSVRAGRSGLSSGSTAWRCFQMGSAGFFVAGLFQCYFQDDEVAAVFWMMIALAGAANFPLHSRKTARGPTGARDGEPSVGRKA